MKRIVALLGKEMLDLRQNPAVFLPAVLTGVASTALPFIVAVWIPFVTGEHLRDSNDVQMAAQVYRDQPAARALTVEAAVQAWLFQQFLLMLTLAPIAGAMSTAAAAVIGEKQARTLEPLLATPLRTVELLTAKVLGSFIPALGIALGCFAIYLAGVRVFAKPGVYMILLTAKSLAIMFIVGPLASLAALQLAVCVSSRANDARSAQQFGALIILPISGLLVGTLMGSLQIDPRALVRIAIGLTILNVALLRIGVALFDRESILTRWK
jgi:ABC-2 type transport system permease protein